MNHFNFYVINRDISEILLMHSPTIIQVNYNKYDR